ncbi:MAG: NAD(P)/FAD-dependent oxidoreductase [Planctomycetota bacterium]|nr:NAD(P)/FAD-dependent oxidoreductase [Planctomycetota bacterium]
MVGANHAGTAAANTILDNYSGHDLTVVDQNDNISYLGCGTALWVGRQIGGGDGLFYSSAGALEKKGAKVFLETAVERIDFVAKQAYILDKRGNRGGSGLRPAEPPSAGGANGLLRRHLDGHPPVFPGH